MLSTSFALVVLAATASGAAWVMYFRWKDKARPEPLWLMAATAGGGAAAVALAAFGFDALKRRGFEVLWESMSEGWTQALAVAFAIGAVEEGAKAVPVVLLAVFCARHFDEWLDGPVYAGCAGIGFALVETGLYGWGGFTALELWPRIVASPLTHGLFAAPMGLGIAAVACGGWSRWGLLLAGAVTSILAHGAYDLALARPGIPGLLSAGVVLLVWAALLALVPRLAKLPPRSETSTPIRSAG